MFNPNPPTQTPLRPSSQAAPVQAKDDVTTPPLRATPSPTHLPLTRTNRPIPHINRVLADGKRASRLGGDTRQPQRECSMSDNRDHCRRRLGDRPGGRVRAMNRVAASAGDV
ncbi:hypothetical protein M422DRAFT_267570 [Sphaerobolus stellatus SS14]|uniref:Uncharacterized protein n=1 Tax=Sphaerobolus stellatus (strain SS14) TaxID=990650 RepID=A0A0C9V0C5_SPHS4|nr:hypothetical protein M422DRAFT_267570 [Sphaerobolus stellatus SS14]